MERLNLDETTASTKISIIVPVLNEANNLRDTLSQLHLSYNEELIIVDGGSTDGTLSIASEFTNNIFKTKTGRASVMNFGAKKAGGDILLFLHSIYEKVSTFWKDSCQKF